MTDITGNSAVAESSNLAGTLREYAGLALICLDPSQRILVLSEEAARLFSLPAAAQPRHLADLPSPLASLVEKMLSEYPNSPERTLELPAADQPLVLRLRLLLWRAASAPGGAILLLTDQTALNRFERSIQRLNRLAGLGTLSASMAHEIKNALVPVRTFIELLLEKQPDAELGQIVRREMGRIDSIVSRMLGFAGPNRPVFSKVSLHQVLQHSLLLVQSQLADKGIRCQSQFGAAPDWIEADPAQLQQALVNLFLNAHEATPTGGALTVSTELACSQEESTRTTSASQPTRIRLTIQDTGPGITRENLAHLFEPFFTTKPHGTGLGLAITQRIIQEHRGSISVESTPGNGTTFRILLPCATSSTTAAEK